MKLTELTKCARCDSDLQFGDMVSENYYAYCPTHDEDLYRFECK